MKKLLVLLVFPLLFVSTATAQHEIGVSLGTSNLLGDFGGGPGNGTLFIKDIEPTLFKPAFGAFYRYNFLKVFGIRGQLLYGTLASDDELSQNDARYARGLNSTSPVIDGTVQLEFNFIPIKYCQYKNSFTPYLAGGIGVSHTRPVIGERADDIDNIALEAEFIEASGAKMGMNIPVSFGLKYKVKKSWMFSAEATYRMSFTDNLDLYDRQQNDAYFFLTANVSYIFCKGGGIAKGVSCPAF